MEGSNIVFVIERGEHTRQSRRWGLAQAEGLRDGYRHSFIVIKMRALSPAHSSLLWSNCVLQRAAASLCDDGLMMAPKENASIEVVQSNVRSQHTAPQEVGLGSG